ncbi:hypothetical protein D3C80_1786510 [compost metagenome]
MRKHIDQCQRLRQADAGDAGRLDARMIAEPGLDGHRRDVLALGGLEQLLDPPGDAQTPPLVQLTTVACAQQAILGVTLCGQLRLLVIADHLRGTFHQDLVVVANAACHSGNGSANVTYAHLSR